VAFAVASLIVTGFLALATWELASGYMFHQREQSAVRQAMVNSSLVRQTLSSPNPDLTRTLAGIAHSPDATLAVHRSSGWVLSGRPIDPTALPGQVLTEAITHSPEPQRVSVAQVSVLVVAVPIPDRQAVLVELFPLTDIDQAFEYLSTVLLAGIAASMLISLTLGRWAGGQALRPLTQFTNAAARVANGDLQARLPEHHDADLGPLAAAFNHTTAALEQRVQRDAQFAGDVSHELRSPLTTMINALAVLNRRHDQLSPTAQHALRLLSADIQRFHQMVLDLLEISRSHSPINNRELEPCDLADLVKHAITTSRSTVPMETDQPPPVVMADRRRLDRAVANLLDNATQHGGGPVHVAVRKLADHARIEIDDAGPGVPHELRHHIFERFSRGNHSGDRPDCTGTGLGLALVAQHIHHHCGSVWVEQRPGGGARFIIELPLAAPGLWI
jgi:signal transduction histidine kinase